MTEFQFNHSNLRARRIALRFSQKLLSRLTGIPRNRLSDLECDYDSPSFEEIKKVFNALAEVETEIVRINDRSRQRLGRLKDFVKRNRRKFQKANLDEAAE